ncbi:uncharacterized protein B0P05DRAFT_521569 [Gilbertella persicaria]|uniref:uncharacterized protein n=1 Tax=Gilbertella persicaria TaxID=101096 RepID=UPI00221F1CCA|nr:uncharacterized protein B0P05DRAFT_521569 [Gilbertella persicaria]KAI8098345.1 hypothetical protein B0P05DRAFT_521569 [Gilbertella persicaria]
MFNLSNALIVANLTTLLLNAPHPVHSQRLKTKENAASIVKSLQVLSPSPLSSHFMPYADILLRDILQRNVRTKLNLGHLVSVQKRAISQ